ncbi:MAG: NYN domain-containing protein [Paracoccaceae bacterium]
MAVLVDGDNMRHDFAEQILSLGGLHGQTDVVRVYCNATHSVGWLNTPGYRVIHSGIGKNGSDLLLAIEAMELHLAEGIQVFVVASSDRDFTHLALRFRERGAKVIGVGETKAPIAFRKACAEFVVIGSEVPQAISAGGDHISSGPSDLDRKIRALIAAHSHNGMGMKISELGPKMHSQHRTRISTHPEKTWRAYLKARGHLFDVDPKGPDARVRFRPAGFN